jgi:hypothetical protein
MNNSVDFSEVHAVIVTIKLPMQFRHPALKIRGVFFTVW